MFVEDPHVPKLVKDVLIDFKKNLKLYNLLEQIHKHKNTGKKTENIFKSSFISISGRNNFVEEGKRFHTKGIPGIYSLTSGSAP